MQVIARTLNWIRLDIIFSFFIIMKISFKNRPFWRLTVKFFPSFSTRKLSELRKKIQGPTIIMGQSKVNCSRKRQILWYLLLCSRITSKWIKTWSITSLLTPVIIREIIHSQLHLGFVCLFFTIFLIIAVWKLLALCLNFWTEQNGY